MNKKNLGMKFVRKCKPEEEKLLKDKFEEYQGVLTKNKSKSIYWANIYRQGHFCLQSKKK